MRSLTVTLLAFSAALSGSLPSNSIPVIAMKSGQDSTMCDITLDFLCMLSWHYFDGIEIQGWTGCEPMTTVADLCGQTGMYATVSPMYLGHLGDLFCDDNWARGSAAIGAVNAFVQSSDSGESVTAAQDAAAMRDTLIYYCRSLIDDEGGWETLWYYDTWNEAPAWQRNRMISESFAYDDYYPGMFTQDTSMSEVLDTGVWSWTGWMLDSLGSEHPLTSTFSTMHQIEFWAGYTTDSLSKAPDFHTQASSVRAFIGTMYQVYDPAPPIPGAVANRPEVLGCNAYPFRQVGIDWETVFGETELGGSLHTWMLEHYEEALDSTIVVASRELDAHGNPFPVHYHPQAFGRVGGFQIWADSQATELAYISYKYRLPSPAEFRMLCHLALLRQAKGIFPYSIRSYSEGAGVFDAGLLDEHLVSFGAPPEEWYYSGRSHDDFHYAPPDLIPPFRDGFDPLCDLPQQPGTSGERSEEDYLEWKFDAYGRLWESLRGTLGEIAVMAPELSGLWWWRGFEDEAEIVHPDSTLPVLYLGPEIRVFTDGEESHAWLYYVNRYCREEGCTFEVSVCGDSLPEGALSGLALDHGRRLFIPVSIDNGTFHFLDTLEAGQGRLVEFLPEETGAEIRITRPDVSVAPGGPQTPVRDFRFTAGDELDIRAVFYNLGTESAGRVATELYDLTAAESLYACAVSLPGLSTDGYVCACDTASYVWDTSPGDAGVHRLRIAAEELEGEDGRDNSLEVVFLLDPPDWAAEVRGDPWDMTEATGFQPAWMTDDIECEAGWTAFTDSVGGMFEGEIDADSMQCNRLHLAVPGPSSGWIDASVYDRLELTAWLGASCELWLGWVSENDRADSCLVAGLDGGWGVRGPFDMGGSLPDSLLKDIWIGFRDDSAEDGLAARIGRVRLTE
ncbi:MAG: hypothetical protein HXY24_10355 [Rubrivivax sp.]|nr:hypothetical protein [Rubrivivax sp.]